MKAEAIVRMGTAADLQAVDAIQQASPEAVRWPPADYLRYHLLVAEAEGVVAGFLVGRQVAPRENEILNLAVRPEFRRRGLARMLIGQFFLDLPGEVFLEVRASSHAAIKLYQSLGFKAVGERHAYYTDSGENGIVLRFQPC